MAVNQYKKDGNSPNDYKKGNRTDSKRETAHLKELSQRYKEDITSYKEFAENRRNNRTVKQEDCGEYYKRLVTYIEECKDKEEPITRADIILTLGVSKSVYYRMKAGELDYRLYEYIDTNSIREEDIYLNSDNLPVAMIDDKEILLIAFGELIEKGELLLEAETERRLYKNAKVTDIFALKSLHGWKEEQSPQTVNQTLVIATEEQARKAIELLK